jgi:hypothetical protein
MLVESLVNKVCGCRSSNKLMALEIFIDGNQVFIIIGFPLNSFSRFLMNLFGTLV